MSLDERKILTSDNHNSNGNPHTQYTNFISFTTPQFSSVGFVKIFDCPIQADLSTIDESSRTLSRLSFTAIVSDESSDADYQEKCFLDVKFRIKGSTSGVVAKIATTPLSHSQGMQIYATLCYKQISNDPLIYQVQVYVYVPVIYTHLRFVFLDFYTRNMPDDAQNPYSILNEYAVNGSENVNVYNRINGFLGQNILNSSIITSMPSDYTQISTLYDQNDKMTYTGGLNMSIYPETRYILVGASSTQTLTTIMIYNFNRDDARVPEVTLIFYNTQTQVVNTGNIDTSETPWGIVLKGRANAVPTGKGDTLTLRFNGTKWIEIARNF